MLITLRSDYLATTGQSAFSSQIQPDLFRKELLTASAESEFASNWTWAGPWTYNHTS